MRKRKKQEKRTPFLNIPLPVPGESLSERLDEAFILKVGFWIVLCTVIVSLILFHWLMRALGTNLNAWHYTIIALMVVSLGIWRVRRAWPELKAMRLGVEGERSVGQGLEELREQGYSVFHDIPGDGFNVDHVLVGPNGVFAVETKAVSKPKRGQCIIDYDGVSARINGVPPERDPIVQAKANARSIARILNESVDERIYVRPVVVYPGWYVSNTTRNPHVLVLNDQQFLNRLKQEPPKLAPKKVRDLAGCLAKHVRNELKRNP